VIFKCSIGSLIFGILGLSDEGEFEDNEEVKGR